MNLSNRLQRETQDTRAGFSLLEVILALGITAIVVTAIGFSMRLHMQILSRQQQEIEAKQIGRGVVTMLANDIRGALQYRAQDFSALQNLELSETMIAGIAATMNEDGDGGGLGDLAAGATGATDAGNGQAPSGVDSGGNGEDEPPQFGDPEAEECASCRPTLVGTARLVSVDVSRLPRIDEYNPLIALNAADTQLPSDVKTVAYFLSDRPPVTASKLKLANEFGRSGGLYRRQIDRAVSAFREETPNENVDQYAELVAPEVANITLRYFDGENWLTEWDSVEAGTFPLAVEIIVVIDPSRADPNTSNYQYGGYDPETMQLYRSVVPLPTAVPPSGGE